MSKQNRLFELDVLRGIAALGVVMYHYTTHYDELYGHSQKVLIYFPFGQYGVELFFIISGFVIFMSLERTKSSLDFIVGRFSRLYPAYWTAVILTFTIVTVTRFPVYQVVLDKKLVNLTIHDALINLTMLAGFFNVPWVDGVYWTLARELIFYTIMFIIYKAKLLKNIEVITILWLLLIVVILGLETQYALVIEQKVKTILLLKHAPLFIIGMIFYKIYNEEFSVKRYSIITACVLVYALQFSSWDLSFFILLIMISLVVIFHLVVTGRLVFIVWKPLIFLGTISYSLYLVHQNIGYVIIGTLYKFGINPNTSIFIAIVFSILLAATITFRIEQPMMRLIKEQYKTKILSKRSLG